MRLQGGAMPDRPILDATFAGLDDEQREKLAHEFYRWAVHNAAQYQDDDLDLYVHWWSWRFVLVHRESEACRVGYEAWKHAQLTRPRSTQQSKSRTQTRQRAGLALALAAVAGAPVSIRAPRRAEDCTHGFGLAGGFSECSACGVKRKKENDHG